MAPASQPPVIPVTQQGPAVTVTPQQATFWVLAGKAQEAFNMALAQKRPWAEVADRTQMAKPESFSEALTRARKNWFYFRINYSLVMTGVVALSLVLHPGSLFFLAALLAGWTYLYLVRTDALVAFGRTFSEREVLTGMSLFTVIMIFMTNVGSILITALMIGAAACFAHGAYRVPDDLFLDEQEASGGFLSFLSSGTVPQINLSGSGPQHMTAEQWTSRQQESHDALHEVVDIKTQFLVQSSTQRLTVHVYIMNDL